ncbi:MAG: FG-GAP-like repeat-containing protein, partial [Chryseolinea sp.]
NAILPNLTTLIKGDGVKQVRFEGLKFAHSAWSHPGSQTNSSNTSFLTKQASVFVVNQVEWTQIPDAVMFRYSNNIEFISNKFNHLGGDGLSFQEGSKNVTIQGNEFKDIAAGAIEVSSKFDYMKSYANNGSGTTPLDSDMTENFTIANNVIQNIANEYFSSVGIFLTLVRNVNVTSNTILDVPYSGISTGYIWNNTPSILGGIHINGNTITNTLAQIIYPHGMSDGAAIYNLGSHVQGSGSNISNNVINNISDVQGASVDANGPKRSIYLDQGSRNIAVTGNSGSGNNYQENIFLNYNYPCEQTGLSFSGNNFTNCFDQWAFKAEWTKDATTNSSADLAQTIATSGITSNGVAFVDVDHDGLVDMVYYYWGSPTDGKVGGYKNTGTGFIPGTGAAFQLPYHLAASSYGDMGVQFVDFDNDGYKDMLYCRDGYPDQCRAYKNTGSGWQQVAAYTPPKPHFNDSDHDLGVRYVDVNHDHYPDVVYFRWINASTQDIGVYLNTHSGWQVSTNTNLRLPYHIAAAGIGETGGRFLDLNGDGYDDMLYWRWNYQQSGAYLSTGTGWQSVPNYVPPYPISIDGMGDIGVRFVDLDFDGLKDLVYHRIVTSTRTEKGVYLNKGGTWQQSGNCDYTIPIPISQDGAGDLGVRFVDLNHDLHPDIINLYKSGSTTTARVYLNGSKTFYCPNPTGRVAQSQQIDETPILDERVEKEGDFTIYPSPANNSIHVKLSELQSNGPVDFKIRDCTGKILASMRSEYSGTDLSIDISTLESGVYMLDIRTSKRTVVKKFVKIYEH